MAIKENTIMRERDMQNASMQQRILKPLAKALTYLFLLVMALIIQ